jgi:hypothetical protein
VSTPALARLYLRPSVLAEFVVWILILAGTFKGLSVIESHLQTWYLPHSANALLVGIPMLAGLFVGATMVEVCGGRFSWTLPGIRRGFLCSTVALGIVSAGLSAALHHVTDGTVPPLPAFALSALCYALIIMVGVTTGCGMLSSRSGLAIVGYGTVNPLASLAATYPLPVCGLALAIAAAALRRSFAPAGFRALTDGPLHSASRPRRDPQWTSGFLGDDAASWVKAFEFEKEEGSLLGVFRRPLVFTVGAVGTCGFLASVGVWGKPLMEGLLLWTQGLHLLSRLPGAELGLIVHKRDTIWMIMSYIIVFYGLECAHSIDRSGERRVDLRPRFLYPLSRRQHALVSFRICLKANLRYTSLCLAAFYATALVSGFVLHRDLDWIVVPSVAAPIVVLFLLTPAHQVFAICYRPRVIALSSVALRKTVLVLSAAGLTILIVAVSRQWMMQMYSFPPALHVMVLLVLAAASQYAFHLKLRRHFLRADLA